MRPVGNDRSTHPAHLLPNHHHDPLPLAEYMPNETSQVNVQQHQQQQDAPRPLTPVSNLILNDSAQIELRELLDHPETSRLNKLEVILSQYPHLNLSNRLRQISSAPHGLGGQSDIFTAHLKPTTSDEEVKVSVKRLRVHIMPDDVKCQTVWNISLRRIN